MSIRKLVEYRRWQLLAPFGLADTSEKGRQKFNIEVQIYTSDFPVVVVTELLLQLLIT